MGSSWTRDRPRVPCIDRQILNHCATREVPYLFIYLSNHSFIHSLIYLWLGWVFVSVRGLSLVEASGGHSSSQCAGLSLSRPLLLWRTGSVAHGAQLLRGMGDPPRPGLEPVSPALAGRLSTTVPPGKPFFVFNNAFQIIHSFIQFRAAEGWRLNHYTAREAPSHASPHPWILGSLRNATIHLTGWT